MTSQLCTVLPGPLPSQGRASTPSMGGRGLMWPGWGVSTLRGDAFTPSWLDSEMQEEEVNEPVPSNAPRAGQTLL